MLMISAFNIETKEGSIEAISIWIEGKEEKGKCFVEKDGELTLFDKEDEIKK